MAPNISAGACRRKKILIEAPGAFYLGTLCSENSGTLFYALSVDCAMFIVSIRQKPSAGPRPQPSKNYTPMLEKHFYTLRAEARRKSTYILPGSRKLGRNQALEWLSTELLVADQDGQGDKYIASPEIMHLIDAVFIVSASQSFQCSNNRRNHFAELSVE